MFTTIQLRRDTAANWITNNTTLSQGEMALEIDTFNIKIGDGSASWSTLPYFNALPTAGVNGSALTTNGSTTSWVSTTGTSTIVRSNGATLTAATLSYSSLVAPALGTPTSGNFSIGSFIWPVFNQNTTGTAAGLSATLSVDKGGTGVTTKTGIGSVVLSHSSTLSSPTFITPVLGTPISGNFNTGTFTWPTFNQNTTGTSSGLSATLSVASGGTGVTSLDANSVLLGNGTSGVQSVAPGSSGNVLTSNGTTWVSTEAPITLPSQSGNASKFLTTNGSTAQWTAITNRLSPTSVKTSNYTSFSNDLVRCNTSSSAFTVTFPAAPADGDCIGIIDVEYTFSGHNLTLLPNSGKRIEFDSSEYILDIAGTYVSFIYMSSSNNWRLLDTPSILLGTSGSGGTGTGSVNIGSPTDVTGLFKGDGTYVDAAIAGVDYIVPGGALGSISSGDFSTGTFTWPTFNQSTTGTAAGLSTTLAVTTGGTGVTTITGILKGNGISAFTAATAGTDFVAPGGALGTPLSGTLTNCTGYTYANLSGTVPTFNQSTTGTAAGLSSTLAVSSGGTGVTTKTGTGSVVLSSNSTLTSPSLITPALGTPVSGNFSTGTFTWPTFNQSTTGTAAGLSATLAVASGGIGVTSLGANSVLLGNGTLGVQSVAPGSSGNVLTSNGTTWSSQPAPVSLPSQTGNSNKFLTTNGSTASWQTLATVATSGSYTDLIGTPTLFSGSYTDLTSKPTLATVATSGSYTDLIGTPTLFSGSYTDLTSKPTLATVATSGSYTDLTSKPTAYTLPTSSTTVLGGVKVDGTTITINGSGVISSAGGYSLPATTTSALGGVIIPAVATSGINNSTGTIGLATASTTQLGGVKVDGTTITIASGIISAAPAYTLPTASSTVLGGIKVGTGLSIASGVLSATATAYTLPATTISALGGVIIPVVATSGITNTSGTIGLATASTTQLGGVKVDGTTITINGSGVISSAGGYSLPTASVSVLGGIKVGSGLTISSGVLSATGSSGTASGFDPFLLMGA